MSDADAIDIVREALALAAALAGPMLLMTLAVGVVVSLVQTVTQIQEQTLTFVPKLVGAGLILLLLGGWMIERLSSFVIELWASIPALVAG